MNTYPQFITEDRRLVILRLLAEDPGYSLNASVLQVALEHTAAHTVSLDQVKTDIAWLAEQGLVTQETITVETVGTIFIAKLTERGFDVAAGRATVPGVKRPRPTN